MLVEEKDSVCDSFGSGCDILVFLVVDVTLLVPRSECDGSDIFDSRCDIVGSGCVILGNRCDILAVNVTFFVVDVTLW